MDARRATFAPAQRVDVVLLGGATDGSSGATYTADADAADANTGAVWTAASQSLKYTQPILNYGCLTPPLCGALWGVICVWGVHPRAIPPL